MFTPPDVPAWRRAFDIVRNGIWACSAPPALGQIFYAFHVYDFCTTYKKKYDKVYWDGFRLPQPHDPPEYEEHRKLMQDVLNYAQFYAYVPSHEDNSLWDYGYRRAVDERNKRADIYAHMNGDLSAGFRIKFNDKTYNVTADLMGVGPFITPHPAPDVEASVYALADIIAPCVGLWEDASA